MQHPIKRREFLGILSLFLTFTGCKKDPLKKPAQTLNNSGPFGELTPAANDEKLGIFNITEIGPNLCALPASFQNLTYGYTDKISYFAGDQVQLYLTGPKNDNKEIFLTDINGKNIFSVTTPITTQQIKSAKPWVDGFMFEKTISVFLPQDLKSGYYVWKLGPDPYETIPVICKNISNSDITVIFPSNTDNAYNISGGKSLYKPDLNNRSTVASFLRYSYRGDFTSGFFKWLSTQNYNVNFVADIDLEEYDNIKNSKAVIITGHSEYWSMLARMNIDKFVESGKNLLVLSGNTMWWQVRYNLEKSLMICYKDHNLDPLSHSIYSTTNWNVKWLKYPITSSLGTDFDKGGFPVKQTDLSLNGFKIANEQSPLLKGTGLKKGDILKLPTFETDGAPVVKVIVPDSSEIPIIDNTLLNFHKIELIGYVSTITESNNPGLGTFIVFKKHPSSGTVVNVASMNWCSADGIGGTDSAKIETITKNMIEASLNNTDLFTN